MLLAIVGWTSLQAQTVGAQPTIEDGEAFYIYRNDGDFNGFFYDDVEEMRYSKVDLEGIIHDEYVIQEVVTADSLYRIPLCAIDSVSFVQPEIVFNPRLKHMDQLGMDKYIADTWGRNFMLSADVPASLVPQVGDVLISFNEELFPKKGGFGGEVYEVDKESDGTYYVFCSQLESLHDIFYRFVTVEKVTADPQGNPVAKMAGYRQIQQADAALSPQRRTDFSYNSDLINFEGTLTREYKKSETKSIAASLAIGIKVGLNMVYDVDMDHIFIKDSLSEDLSAQAKFSASFSGDWEPDLAEIFNKIGAIKFPLTCPVFETHPLPTPFFRVNATLGIEAQLPAIQYSAKQMVIFSDRVGSFLNCRFSDNCLMGGVNEKMFKPSGAEVSLAGYVQAGIKLTTDVTTNSWVSDFFYGGIGVVTHIGPKLSGSINCDLNLLSRGNAYEAFENSKVVASLCDVDIDAEASLFIEAVAEEKKTIASTSFSKWKEELFLLPHLKAFDIKQNDEYTNADISMTWERRMLLACYAGYILYKFDLSKMQFVECDRNSQFHYKDATDIFLNYTSLKPGHYKAVPFVRIPGIDTDITAEALTKEFNINYTLKLDRDEIIIPGSNNGESILVDVHFETDAPDINVNSNYAEVDMKTNVIHFNFPPNTQLRVRKDTIFVYGAGERRGIYFEQAMDLERLTAIEIDFSPKGHYEFTEQRYTDGKLGGEESKQGDLRYWFLLPCTVTQSGSVANININYSGKPLFSSYYAPGLWGGIDDEQIENIVGTFRIGICDDDDTLEGSLSVEGSAHSDKPWQSYDESWNFSTSFTFVETNDENAYSTRYPLIGSFIDERTCDAKLYDNYDSEDKKRTRQTIRTYRGIYEPDREGEKLYEHEGYQTTYYSSFDYKIVWSAPDDTDK